LAQAPSLRPPSAMNERVARRLTARPIYHARWGRAREALTSKCAPACTPKGDYGEPFEISLSLLCLDMRGIARTVSIRGSYLTLAARPEQFRGFCPVKSELS